MTDTATATQGAAPATAERRGPGRLLQGPLLGALGIVGFLGLWEVASRGGLIDDKYLPAASVVLRRAAQNLGEGAFWTAAGHTMLGWALGLLIAAVSAIVLGLVIGASGFLRAATHSTIEFLRPIPSVALIPLAVLLFGTSLQSTLLLVVYASFWQVLIQVLYGVGDVDPVADDTARSFGLGTLARVRYLVWPTALPYVMTGLRLGAAVALILAITGELVIGGGGLGNQIALAQSGGAVAEMYALILATGLIGVLINMVARLVERHVLAWHVSVRGETAA
jgi:ABC-type nitrate/sulfonate/bicarbonate transport system permease component